MDLEVLCLLVHATVDMLSQKSPMCAPCIFSGMICSKMIQPMRRPAISKSFIDIVPCGLSFVFSMFWMTIGHSSRQTHWCVIGFDPCVHTPPIADLEESVYPM